MKRPKLPVGIENFQEIRQADFYYVDKTRLIEQLIDQWGKVNLFTRPRRFGKTLNMSMLRCFFEIGADEALFEGLYISQKQELCEQYMGKFPVVFLSLKNVDGLTFENARYQLTELVGREASRFLFLLESDRLTETDKMEEEIIALVEDYLDDRLQLFGEKWHEIPFTKGGEIGRTVDYSAGRNRYIGYLISLGVYSFKGMRIGLDCANGSAWNIAKAVFDALGAKTYVINAEPDGTNINNNAGSTHIEGLQKLVVEKGLDVGFAYDGDADRCLCVDEKGNVVSGDAILYVYGRYMKERGKLLTNTVVTTVMSNFGLYKAFDALDIEYAKTAVGDKYVYEYMMQNGCRIGGEQSGHIIFSKYASTGDGILTSLKMMEVIMARKKKLSELTADLAIYPQVLENVRVHDKAAAQADVDVQAAVERVAEALGDTGRILVRESGTEPLLRVMVEAESEELCRKYVDQVVEIVRKKGHVAE